MQATIQFTLNNGQVFTDRKAMAQYLDDQVSHHARKLAIAMSNKNASEIMVVLAHEGMLLARSMIDAENYQEEVRRAVGTISLTDSSEDDQQP